jgi:hypothetical protein
MKKTDISALSFQLPLLPDKMTSALSDHFNKEEEVSPF